MILKSLCTQISDLAHRMRFDVNAIFRYYAALGTAKIEEMYAVCVVVICGVLIKI